MEITATGVIITVLCLLLLAVAVLILTARMFWYTPRARRRRK